MNGDSPSTELELVAAARHDPASKAGRAAVGELLRRYRQSVYLWCYRYVRSHERALDMSQDVLIQAYERIGQFEGRSAFSSWLFVIARNRCLNEMRRDQWMDDVDLEALPDGRVPIDERLDETLRGDRLNAVANRVLNPLERRAVWLRYSERMPVDAITSVLGLDQKSGARGLLQRARRKLRAAIEGEDGARPMRGGDRR
jgi:RNA polymerase sigma-70 factor, ECF subfamily